MTEGGQGLRVLLVAVNDLAGGNHRSAYRLHQSLRAAGVDSIMAVREKASSDPHEYQMSAAVMGWPTRGRGFLDRLPGSCLINRDEPISLGLQSVRLDRMIDWLTPDETPSPPANGWLPRLGNRVGLPTQTCEKYDIASILMFSAPTDGRRRYGGLACRLGSRACCLSMPASRVRGRPWAGR